MRFGGLFLTGKNLYFKSNSGDTLASLLEITKFSSRFGSVRDMPDLFKWPSAEL